MKHLYSTECVKKNLHVKICPKDVRIERWATEITNKVPLSHTADMNYKLLS